MYVTDTGEPVPSEPLPNDQCKVPVPVPRNVHLAPLHEAAVIAAGVGGAATVTGPVPAATPQPTLLQARTA
jgi:hypothetical protein